MTVADSQIYMLGDNHDSGKGRGQVGVKNKGSCQIYNIHADMLGSVPGKTDNVSQIRTPPARESEKYFLRKYFSVGIKIFFWCAGQLQEWGGGWYLIKPAHSGPALGI